MSVANGLCSCTALQERSDSDLNQVTVTDGKEPVSDGQGESNGLHQLPQDPGGPSNETTFASATDRVEQVRCK